jgi:hypothetical protein
MNKKLVYWLLLCLLEMVPGRSQTVNCLVAVVNGQVVTLTDLEIAREFELFDRQAAGAPGDPRLAVLEALIGQKVVLDMTRGPLAVGKDEISLALESLREKFGPDAFRGKLVKFGLGESDLRPYLEDRLKYKKIVTARFSATIPVSRGDVEKYYREVYVPQQKAKRLEPDGIESVLSDLEAKIREDVRARQVAEWVKAIRAQAEVRTNTDCLR